ncbi:DHA2 family efflux MFS transporter permease subunit [Actinomadura fibrosa]|uniref:DHA2 family efflux MFS transporter permease subunit n=1 Tax=Actinomadura fibrosa TaxID=111802 RepID=UPI001041727A|nr:DHA2 family efflux MFS transporter permease subunit [Actinomadura fibrosa]
MTRKWVLGLASAASVMVALDATVVTTALSRIRLDLGTSMEQLEWTVNAYSLSFAVLLMTGAVLGDRFGRRRMFTAGLVLFTAASAACALAPGTGWLIAARAVQGAGAAFVMPLAMALLSAAYPPPDRPKALGAFAGLTGLAVVGGPVLGGAVTQGLAWEWIFWLNLPIGAVIVPLVLRRVPESRGGGRSVDAVGLVLVTGAALGLVWGLVRSDAAGWGSPEVAGTLAAGAVLAVAFVAWERVARQPMVPLGLFRHRGFAAGNAAGLLLYAALYGCLFFSAQFFQTGRGDRPLGAGLHLLAWTASVTVVAPVAGRLVNRTGARPLAATGLALQAAGMGWLALAASPTVPYWELIAPMLVAGAGVSMAMPAVQTAVLNAVAPQQIGNASGVFNTGRQFGGVLGVAVLALALAATALSFGYNAATARRARPPAGLAYVQADGIATRYRQWGAQGPPVVLVHGAAESADTWNAVASLLAADHRVYALDLTGWGYSERRAPYDAAHQAAQLLGFLDALRLGKAALVGHSSGAGVVAEAALRAPSRVAGVAFLDGDALDTGAGEGSDRLRFVLRDPYRTTLLRLAVRSDWVIRTIYGAQCGPSCARLDRAGLDQWRRPLQVPGAERALWEMQGVVGLPASRVAGLAGLAVPKAVVFGADDDVFSSDSPADTARRIGAPPPVIIPGARHLSLISHPHQVATALAPSLGIP